MGRIVWVLMAMALGTQQASAVDNLSWKWEKDRRFLLISDVSAPEHLVFRAEKNFEARVYKWRSNIVVSCAPEALGKKASALACTIEDISLQAMSIPADLGSLPAVLEDLDQKMTGAVIQVEMTNDGRIRNVDLEGIDKRHRRLNQIVETMRLVVARAMAVMDLQLPKKGDDKGEGNWPQKQTLVTSFPSTVGTLGSVRTVHEIVENKDDAIIINSTGKGIAGSGRMIQVAGQEQIANMYDIEYAGQSVFDRKDGSLTAREYQLRGTVTSSSELSGAWKGMPYMQYSKLMRLSNSEKPNLGESRPMVTKDAAQNK
jgi:hypothetical protein